MMMMTTNPLTEEKLRALFQPTADLWSSYPHPDQYKKAAVLLLLAKNADGWAILFTRRTESVQNHKGQVAFPGGGMEEADKNLVETALREAREEIGINLSQIEVLGKLPPFPTISNFVIYPVVALYNGQNEFVLSTDEVVNVFYIPITWLDDPENWYESPYVLRNGKMEKVIHYKEYAGENLWGITARIVHQLLAELRKG